MKLYIKAISSYRGNLEEIDIKKELKQTYKHDTRRQDKFIYLALYGAFKLQERSTINVDDELYITSGVGNMDIVHKSNEYVNVQKEILRPFDFINMLGNTTSYYVASALGVKSKNIFSISNSFTFINTLISIYASLSVSKKEAVLGSVDLVPPQENMLRRVLGLSPDINVVSATNYQKLSLNSDNAVASIEFGTESYTLEEVETLSQMSELKVLHASKNNYFETMPSYYINMAIESGESILYIDSSAERYKIIKLLKVTDQQPQLS